MDPFDFINRANADYIERLYQTYKSDPRLLEPHWKAFFAGFDLGNARAGTSPAAMFSDEAREWSQPNLTVDAGDLVHSYRELGHFIANLDPLGHHRPNHPLLDLQQFGLTLNDLDRPVGQTSFLGKTDGTVRDLLEKLRLTYCSTIGVEYLSIADKTQREWLQQRIEPSFNHPACGGDECKAILYQIVAAQGFEEYLETKYVGQKRFSLEGAESLIPMMNAMVDDGAELGVEEIVIGMAHRGRLNVLAHVLNKRYELILSEFEGKAANPVGGDGDVKYHLGYSNDRITRSGKKVHVSLSYNPSHLELVNPVAEGIVRAKQYYLEDTQRTRVVPILIHGDAAFCGQGIVQETLALSEMPYWRTGGTIHIIVNNQIGFTTMPKQGRFTPYPTDVAKMIQAPIFHVNGDDPEAVVHVAKMAIAFRQQFHCDVMIDMWCYRRHGHNEGDDPTYTQPLMYKEIAEHPRPREVYSQKLIDGGKIAAPDLDEMKVELRTRLDAAQKIAREERPKDKVTMLGGIWTGMTRAGNDWSADTAISQETIRFIGDRGTSAPEGFTVHPKLQRLVLEPRRKMSLGELPVDWGCAEMFAMGSLVLEGTPIRFVGQDAQRGTFGHRHACLHDYNTGEKYYPLANLKPGQAPIIVVNTMLSELAVVGFEYGFASADPRNMVIWEAQFGDFVNGAQAVIDQFIGAAESKWGKMCGLVMLLPHGYEGAGPEHSNAYIERFLTLSADNNWQVCYPSSASQYFHMLRRQMRRTFRKPLIVMTPKKLLRLDMAASPLKEFTEGQYQLVLDDPTEPDREKVKRLLLCTGKVYYSLHAERLKHNLDNVAIVRVEQLYPFPQKEVQAILSRYRNAQDVCWVQEEPRNRGAWAFMRHWLEQMLSETAVLTYVGRDEASSPATGSYKIHEAEERELVSQALDLPSESPSVAPTPAKPELAPVGH
ncbi:MAG TPA: 2-oxoglutarate dehydrogenase E1 component [Tepidisphaeraceae bacterium]|nr:2-oxoglutarate dehydrogenase E1 component [Tepidisphaeraceae bacterium]